MSATPDVTRLLVSWGRGDKSALDEMTPLLYEELRRVARRFLAVERADHTLEPTALVHEAYLRLVDQRQVDWRNRAQFLGLAASMMRRILINHAHAHHAAKRGVAMVGHLSRHRLEHARRQRRGSGNQQVDLAHRTPPLAVLRAK